MHKKDDDKLLYILNISNSLLYQMVKLFRILALEYININMLCFFNLIDFFLAFSLKNNVKFKNH